MVTKPGLRWAKKGQNPSSDWISASGRCFSVTEAVITGLGPIAPNGFGKSHFWEALKMGRSGIRRVFGDNGTAAQIAGRVPREWLDTVLNGDSSNETAWPTVMIMAAARLALEDAGLSQKEFASCNSAIVVGVSLIDMEMTEKEFYSFKEYGVLSPFALASANPHAPASHIARELHCSGKVITYAGTCSSGLLSISSGAEMILRGEADVLLAGGGDSCITPFVVSSFTAAGLHPPRFGDDPTVECRPFDARREGGVLSEGAGIVVLESIEHARRRGAHIYARVTGWGMANATLPMSTRDAFASAMEQALAKAGIEPGMVDYVSAHAPGIKLSDRLEVAAIKRVFGSHAYNLSVSSIKSMIGNPLAASGPLQVIAVAQAMEHSFIPPTINYQYSDAGCDLDFVPNFGRVARVATAVINSSGIGGCIASLILAKPQTTLR